jgi:branched-chain amino acid transport system ATP-binding protein
VSLALERVDVHYGSAHVLRGASLRVEASRIVCLLGRNGAGKSTTLKSVMGLVPTTGGRISLDGARIDGKRPHAIAGLGIAWVPEDRRVFGSLTVEENLRVAAQATARSAAGLDDAFALFPDLRARARQSAASLSGGQQQMLAIGRALVTRPRVLLLDEPTEGLAPALVGAIRASIEAVRTRGMAVLLVEQNLGLALGVGDYFYVLSRGALAFEGTRDELASRPEVITDHLGVGRVKALARPS